jgi:hypothetical protein
LSKAGKLQILDVLLTGPRELRYGSEKFSNKIVFERTAQGSLNVPEMYEKRVLMGVQ